MLSLWEPWGIWVMVTPMVMFLLVPYIWLRLKRNDWALAFLVGALFQSIALMSAIRTVIGVWY